VENHLAPRSQWVAVTVLATVILSILLVRLYHKDLPPSDIPSNPLIAAIEGDVREPGIYLLEGPDVTAVQAIESAGGLRNGSSRAVPEVAATRNIRSGQLVRVMNSGQGPMEIRVETMPAPASLTLGQKLNVNTASEEELMLVPQMKAVFAATIVNRRSKIAWQSLDELEEIPGVGPKTVERWRNYLQANDNCKGGTDETEE
jgi:DNA uptake protein ComE-like DNA-binding protein